jgi:hypothetical protein
MEVLLCGGHGGPELSGRCGIWHGVRRASIGFLKGLAMLAGTVANGSTGAKSEFGNMLPHHRKRVAKVSISWCAIE